METLEILFVISETILLFIISFSAGRLISTFIVEKEKHLRNQLFWKVAFWAVILFVVGLIENLFGFGEIIDTEPIITKADGAMAFHFQIAIWALYFFTFFAGLLYSTLKKD